ncbi:MAG: hypothetical protein A2Y91_06035 [Chloroflexi bacterium RBG_13_54_8]|nr:MAG: hypothetical protein A2Y91_06035 [Chloroflexi bacterium RBG_13_54_8]
MPGAISTLVLGYSAVSLIGIVFPEVYHQQIAPATQIEVPDVRFHFKLRYLTRIFRNQLKCPQAPT